MASNKRDCLPNHSHRNQWRRSNDNHFAAIRAIHLSFTTGSLENSWVGIMSFAGAGLNIFKYDLSALLSYRDELQRAANWYCICSPMIHVYKLRVPTTWIRVCKSCRIEVSHAASYNMLGARAHDYRFNLTRPDRLDPLRRTYSAATWIFLTRLLRNDIEYQHSKGETLPFLRTRQHGSACRHFFPLVLLESWHKHLSVTKQSLSHLWCGETAVHFFKKFAILQNGLSYYSKEQETDSVLISQQTVLLCGMGSFNWDIAVYWS